MGSLRFDHAGVGWTECSAITKIITSTILSLLMVIGAWTASHAEPDALVLASSVTATDQTIVTTAPETGELASAGSVVLAGNSSGAGLGLTACLLGALCGLALAVFFLRLLRDREPPILSTSRAHTSQRSPVTGHAPKPPTLTQLSISRT